MSLTWSAEYNDSDIVARGIEILQRNADHDATLRRTALDAARRMAQRLAPVREWVPIEKVARDAQVNESVASNAVWQLCDDGVLTQDLDTSELSLAL